MRAQHGDDSPVEADRAAARSRLRVRLVHGVGHAHPSAANCEHAGVEVDVVPPQPGQLTSSHPRGQHEHPQRVQTIVGDRGEEPARLIGSPRSHLGRVSPRRLHADQRAPHEQAPQHRVVERFAQHAVHHRDRCRRQLGTTSPAAVRDEVGVQTSDEECVEVRQLHPTESGPQVPLHDLAVALGGRRLQRRRVPGEPLDRGTRRPSGRLRRQPDPHRPPPTRDRAPARPRAWSRSRPSTAAADDPSEGRDRRRRRSSTSSRA